MVVFAFLQMEQSILEWTKFVLAVKLALISLIYSVYIELD